jgi:phosphatidylserine/phosphatidylglycerophosphate/cardiolipin synthase-like enzyme
MLAALLSLPARAAFTVPGFELVYSAPEQTNLQRPELRRAAEVWPGLINSAKSTIDIAEFYIAVTTAPDNALEPTLDALRRAGKRGVKIRFLLEKKMEQASQDGMNRLRDIKNLELRVIDFSKVKHDGIVHAKYMVADDTEAYIGSQNFDWRSLQHIHELGLLTSEPNIVRGAAAIFAQDWKAYEQVQANQPVPALAKAPAAAPAGSRAYLVASPWAYNPPGVGDSQSELVRLIASARQEINIQLLDYAPLSRDHRFYAPIDNALRDAAVRGVRIRLLVSDWNTDRPAIFHLKSLSLIPGVQIKIITIPQAREGYIPFARVCHSKYMVIDGKTLWLGTSNWSGGYLDNSRNLEVVVNDAALAAEALSVHGQLWNSQYAEPIDVNMDYPRPRR